MARIVMLIGPGGVGGAVLDLLPPEAFDRGQELMRRFREYGERHGARFHEHGRQI